MENVRLAPVDVEIIRFLNRDARTSLTKLADRLGMPESTVRYRLNRLVRGGVLEFTAVTNPLRLGYQIWAVLEVQAELRKIRTVAQHLAELPEVFFVGMTTGTYDVLAAAVFRSNAELVQFITGKLPQIPGIVRTSTSNVLEVLKRSMANPLPDERSAANPGRNSAGIRAASRARSRSRALRPRA